MPDYYEDDRGNEPDCSYGDWLAEQAAYLKEEIEDQYSEFKDSIDYHSYYYSMA